MIVSVFIGTTFLFIGAIPNWMQYEIIPNLDQNSEIINEIGRNYEETVKQIKEKIDEDKETYGEDYPAEEIFLINVVNCFSSSNIVKIYSISFLIGIALGTIIYIVAIQNAKGKELIIKLFLTFIILFVIMLILNIGYEAIINIAINQVASTGIKYNTGIYELDNINILISYIIAIAVIYIGNMIYQKIITNRLNKELNKK